MVKKSNKLTRWQQSNVGQRILAALHDQLQKKLPQYFGFHLLQINDGLTSDWLNFSPIRHQIILTHLPHPQTTVLGAVNALPFQSDSIDVVILPCILEHTAHREELIAEAWRVLIPNGKLIILGFNPLGVFGLRRKVSLFKQYPWSGKFISVYKLKKILTSLGCSIDEVEYFSPQANSSNQHLPKKRSLWENIARFCFMPFSGMYQITATKQIIRLTPIRPKWQTVVNEPLADTVRNMTS